MNTKILTLKIEDADHEGLVEAVAEMLRLLKERYTSGLEPYWGLEEINN